MSTHPPNKFKIGDTVTIVHPSLHAGVTGRVIQNFGGMVTVMPPNHVTVAETVKYIQPVEQAS